LLTLRIPVGRKLKFSWSHLRGSKDVFSTFSFHIILVLFQNTSLCVINCVLGASKETGSSGYAGSNEKIKIGMVCVILLMFKIIDDNARIIHLRIGCVDQFKLGL
jgi:hypothetical protein